MFLEIFEEGRGSGWVKVDIVHNHPHPLPASKRGLEEAALPGLSRVRWCSMHVRWF